MASLTSNLRSLWRPVLRQPLLKVRELDGPRFLQRTGGESAKPLVMDAERARYFGLLPNSLPDRLSGLFNAFFYAQGS